MDNIDDSVQKVIELLKKFLIIMLKLHKEHHIIIWQQH